MKKIFILLFVIVSLSSCVTTFKATVIEDDIEKSFEPTIHYVNTLVSKIYTGTAMVTRSQFQPNASMAPAIHESFKDAFVNYSPFLNPVVEKEEGAVLKEDEYYVFTILHILENRIETNGNPNYSIGADVCVVRGDETVFMSKRIVTTADSAWTVGDAQDKAVKAYMDKFYEEFSKLDFSNPPELDVDVVDGALSNLKKWY